MRVTWQPFGSSDINDITPCISSVTWAGTKDQASRSLTIAVAYDPYDSNIKMPDIKTGDVLRFYDDNDKLKFLGKTATRERTGEVGTIQYLAYDYLQNLLKSKGSYTFRKKTAQYITKAICRDLKISVGKLPKKKTTLKKVYAQDTEYYNIILLAWNKVRKKTGKKYMMRMNGTKLEVVELGSMIKNFVIKESEVVSESNYSESSEDLINRVKIYNSKNHCIGTLNVTGNSTKRYGIYQDSVTVDKGSGKSDARKLITGVSKEASVTCIGDVRCMSGRAVSIKDATANLTGKFWIIGDTHTWEDGKYSMQLQLAWKNVMEDPDSQNESSGSSGSITISGVNTEDKYIYKYVVKKTVKAQFTGYCASNAGDNGGLKAANGEKLNYHKHTCAAPPALPFGTRIVPHGTTYDSVNGKVYRVNDRGGAIQYINGRFQIDLLTKSEAYASKFGRQNGTMDIVIRKKVKNPNYMNCSTEARKVVEYALSWLGKGVTYGMGAQSLAKGGKSDCSYFVSTCLKRAGGYNPGRTTGAMAGNKKGLTIHKIKDLRPGDVILFKSPGGSVNAENAHCGIVISKTQYIDCSYGRNGIHKESLNSSYARSRFWGGKRFV